MLRSVSSTYCIPIVLTAITLGVLGAVVAGSSAQPRQTPAGNTPPPVVPSPAPTATPEPLITVRDEDGKPQPIGIKEASVAVTTQGMLAKTVVTIQFHNDTERVLEGDLDFPLPEGAALSGYALDINGEMADAVPVPKHEARVILEKEIRKGIDPGLVEQTAGNNFRTRLYPIPAKGSRTIRVEYVSQAGALDDSGMMRVLIPLHWNQTVPLLRLSVASDAPVKATLGGRERDLLADGDHRIKTLENIRVEDDLVVSVDAAKSAALSKGVLVEPFTKASGVTETYFAVVGAPTEPVTDGPVRRPGRRIGLVWDASLSRRSANITHELSLLKTLAKEKWQDAIVDVTILRDRAEPVKTFSITSGNATELIAYLKAQPFDGGTDLSALKLTKAAVDKEPYAYWLLFTDGLSTLGATDRPGVQTCAPVFAVGTDSRGNHSLLRYLTAQTGGDYVNTTIDARKDEAIMATIGESPYSLLSVTVDEGTVKDLTPSGVVPVAPGYAISVTGRLVSDTAKLTLHYGYPNVGATATRTVTVAKADAPAASAGLVGAIWAQKRADTLAVSPEKNSDALAALGRDYHIVTPGTSLLVLETLEQHLEYSIAPAKSRKALYAEYIKAAEARGIAQQKETRNTVNVAVNRWRERVRWWDKDYKYADNFRFEENKRKQAALGIGSNGVTVAAGRASASVRLREGVAVREVHGYASGSGTPGRGEPMASLAPPVAMENAPRPVSTAEAQLQVTSPGGDQGLSRAGAVAQNRVALSTENAYRRPDALGAFTLEERAKRESDDLTSDGISNGAPVVAVKIKEWTPNAPYLKTLAAAKTGTAAYTAYLKERAGWADAPAFYFDCAEALHRRGANDLAVRVLTGITDLKLEDPALLRIVAHRLAQWGYREKAIPLFEKVAELRPEEPQSFRDLALVLADRGDALASTNPGRAIVDYNRALVLLNKVVVGQWDRFEGITDIALNEANRVIVRAKMLPTPERAKLVVPLDSRLVKNMGCDMRVVMTWDTDNTDMDLHVIEPSGEECFYSHNHTVIGGRLSDDFTQGYGPEEYLVKRGMKGKYAIRSNYYGSREQRLSGGTTVQATVYTDWGRPTEKHQSLSLRLTKDKETVTIGDIHVGK